MKNKDVNKHTKSYTREANVNKREATVNKRKADNDDDDYVSKREVNEKSNTSKQEVE